ncbi:hypothetical protein [Euzebya tangerina]|uniref:hypothetical protein n=1 Tax=Euzebya tangerina TaxID=591198 RepID=UPI00196AF4D9|nr:hypothetical protein [Euzebya tangerina]
MTAGRGRRLRWAGLLVVVVAVVWSPSMSGAQPLADEATGGPTEPRPDTTPEPVRSPTPSEIPPASVGAPLDEPAPPPDDVDQADEGPDDQAPVLAPIEGLGSGASPERGDPSSVPDVVEDIRGYDEEEFSAVDLVTELLGEHASPADRNLAHYELGASVDLVDRAFVTIARFFFSIGVWVFTVAGWVLRLVLRFDIAHLLSGDVSALSQSYGHLLRGGRSGIPLSELMLLLAIAHAGWQIFRHRAQAAMGEVLVAVSIALIGGGLLHGAENTACTGLSVMSDLTVGMMELGSTDGDPDQARSDYCAGGVPAQSRFDDVLNNHFDTFVHEPFMVLQWGSIPDPESACGAVAGELVEQRAWDNIDEPRRWMNDVGCPNMSLFNARMSASRVMASGAYAVATAAFGVAVMLTAGTLLIAQVAGVLLILAMPVAFVAGIAPGAGRELLARWFHSLLKVAVLFMGSGFFLSLLLTSVGTVLDRAFGQPIVVRMALALVLAWALVIVRGRVFKSMRFAARSTAARVAGPGADVGAQGRGPGAAVGGAVARGTARAAATAADVHAGAVAVKAGITVVRQGLEGLGTGLAPTALNRGSRLRAMSRRTQQPREQASGT